MNKQTVLEQAQRIVNLERYITVMEEYNIGQYHDKWLETPEGKLHMEMIRKMRYENLPRLKKLYEQYKSRLDNELSPR